MERNSLWHTANRGNNAIYFYLKFIFYNICIYVETQDECLFSYIIPPRKILFLI